MDQSRAEVTVLSRKELSDRMWQTPGNYVHPQLRVVSINGVPVNGRVYYPSCDVSKFSMRRERSSPWRGHGLRFSPPCDVLNMPDPDIGYPAEIVLLLD